MAELDDGVLAAFVDGELEPERVREVARAIAEDPAAHEKVRLLQVSAELVRAALDNPAYRRVPTAVERAIAGPSRLRLALRRHGYALAASLALLVLGFGAGLWVSGKSSPTQAFEERLIDEIADYHVVYARETDHLVEVPASERQHIEAWLGDRLQRTLHVPDLADRGLAFEGARLLVVDGRPVAQLMYARPGDEHHPLAICITFGGRSDSALRTESREGLNLVTWRTKGYAYVVAGWATPSFLTDLAVELSPQLQNG